MSEQVRDEALNVFLLRLRKEAGLSVDQVCERTKIQSRFVQALEDGRFGELPSNTHLRAFSLAIAQVCGGDSEQAALLVRRVLEAVAAPVVSGAPASLATPSPVKIDPVAKPKAEIPRPAAAARPAAPMVAVSASSSPAAVATHNAAAEAAQAADGMVQGASQRLKALPWQALLILVGGAIVLSWGLMWGLQRWQNPSAPSAGSGEELVAAAEGAAQSKVVAATAVSATAEGVAPTQLVLRARRPCWLLLEVDGQRLPLITLNDGDKQSWPVRQKAVLLAGNVGALRVWWRGDNLGYLGELNVRANAIVFEPGKALRFDKGAALPLPAGVPE